MNSQAGAQPLTCGAYGHVGMGASSHSGLRFRTRGGVSGTQKDGGVPTDAGPGV
jgi:hypothetical protein